MCRCEEKVKEGGLGAESLTLFSNDWFDLMVCVNLFTYLIYIRYIELSFAVISLILKLKAAGMSNSIYAQYRTEM